MSHFDELDADILEWGTDEDVLELAVKKAIGQRIREKLEGEK
jgi:hypothetical protein